MEHSDIHQSTIINRQSSIHFRFDRVRGCLSDAHQHHTDKYGPNPDDLGDITGFFEKNDPHQSPDRNAELAKCGHVIHIRHIIHRGQNKAIRQINTDPGGDGGSLKVAYHVCYTLALSPVESHKNPLPERTTDPFQDKINHRGFYRMKGELGSPRRCRRAMSSTRV